MSCCHVWYVMMQQSSCSFVRVLPTLRFSASSNWPTIVPSEDRFLQLWGSKLKEVRRFGRWTLQNRSRVLWDARNLQPAKGDQSGGNGWLYRPHRPPFEWRMDACLAVRSAGPACLWFLDSHGKEWQVEVQKPKLQLKILSHRMSQVTFIHFPELPAACALVFPILHPALPRVNTFIEPRRDIGWKIGLGLDAPKITYPPAPNGKEILRLW